mgnify:CR=1 FL=1
MKKAFTIIEVSILFLVFLIVAFLVAPLSFDDTIQARNIAKWRNVQPDFVNIFNGFNTNNMTETKTLLTEMLSDNVKSSAKKYKITYLNRQRPQDKYIFDDFRTTYSNATISTKFFESPNNDILGIIMYDVNGSKSPNIWGRDVYGFNIYKDHIEPFCKQDNISIQRSDCSRHGSGLCCSNYYLIGGSFD